MLWLIAFACATPQIKVIFDDEAQAFLQDVVGRITTVMGVPGKVPIYIIDDADANAAVVAQNNMVVHSGLFLRCQNASEMVGVLAHEVGHIKGMHALRYTKADNNLLLLGVGLGLGLATGGAGFAVMAAGMSVAHREQMRQYRIEEISADSMAVQALKKLHWSADGLIQFLTRFQHLDAMIGDPYLLTHPTSTKRITTLKAQAFQGGTLPPTLRAQFVRVKAKLTGYLEKNTQALDPYERAMACLITRHFAQGLDAVQILLRTHPDDPYFHETHGDLLLESGQLAKAQQAYEKAHQTQPKAHFIAMKLAQTLIAQKTQLDHAIGLLNRVKTENPDMAYPWYLLAKAYGCKKQLGNADHCLLEEARIQDDKPTMRRLLRKNTLPESQTLRQRRRDIESIAMS